VLTGPWSANAGMGKNAPNRPSIKQGIVPNCPERSRDVVDGRGEQYGARTALIGNLWRGRIPTVRYACPFTRKASPDRIVDLLPAEAELRQPVAVMVGPSPGCRPFIKSLAGIIKRARPDNGYLRHGGRPAGTASVY
jgi:hypothetical protein